MSDQIEMPGWRSQITDEARSDDDHDDMSRSSEESARVNIIKSENSKQHERSDHSREVNRFLGPLPLCMITCNGVLGVGLYWRGGDIVEIGGPVAVVLAFVLMGILAWAVMQCLTELLCLWPVPGAIYVYIDKFVDRELGIAVGIAYWFTYSISFAALLSTIAAEAEYWNSSPGIRGAIIFLLVPLTLVLINSFGIEVYGFVETIVGFMKISFFVVMTIILIAINAGAGNDPSVPPGGNIGSRYWNKPGSFEHQAAPNWFVALLMALSMAGFAFVGVEIIAASALEAKWPSPRPRLERPNERGEVQPRIRYNVTLVGETIRFSAVWIPVFAAIAYTIAGCVVASDIVANDCLLGRQSWVSDTYPNGSLWCNPNGIPYRLSNGSVFYNGSIVTDALDLSRLSDITNINGTSIAPFVAIAKRSKIPGLENAFNFFLIFTAVTCANTNLYVASRTFFGLTSRLQGGKKAPFYIQFFAWFGKTNNRKVPMRAMVISALAFWWVPFLSLGEANSKSGGPVAQFIEALAQMGTVGVIVVWACVCLAFLRYYFCIQNHKNTLEEKEQPRVRRWLRHDDTYDDYPYRSHGQPVTGILALGSCLFILLIANGAFLWNGFQTVPFVSAYVTLLVFGLLVAMLKIINGAPWWGLVDLSQYGNVVRIFEELDEIGFRGAAEAEPPKSAWNLWGRI